MSPPSLFDRHQRRLRRDRAMRSGVAPFLHVHAFDELIDRLGDVRRTFGRALLLGCADPSWRGTLAGLVGEVVVADPSPVAARRSGGLVADEDRLPFADASFDLILATGTLDGIDDLPGALVLLRRVLRPDGLLLGAMAGAGSLPRLRAAMLAADAATGGAAARMHPAVDVRTLGDLLSRAGFALPVADFQGIDVSYADMPKLIADLRAHGATNILAKRSRLPLSRHAFAAAVADFAPDPGIRTIERAEILYLSGWAPAPDQPRPARRGSATHSLADALRSSKGV